MSWFSELKENCTALNRKAMSRSYRQAPCLFNRGRVIAAMKDNERLDDGNVWVWNGTKKHLMQAVESLAADGAEVIFVEGGIDGADSPRHYFEYCDYEPWIDVWEIEFWSKEKGFDHKDPQII